MDPALFDLTPAGFAAVALCAAMVGLAKTGLPGVAILSVPIMAWIFPAGPSTGIYLPMLIVGDLFAVSFYRRHARWQYVLKPLPWAMAGIVIAHQIIMRVQPSNIAMRRTIGVIVLMVLALGMLLKSRQDDLRIPRSWWFAALIGMLGGYTTMTANAAGPIWIVYLLALQLPKSEFLGTNAWVFLILNCFKVPFSRDLNFISAESLMFNLKMIPAIAAGAIGGYYLAKVLRQGVFDTAVKLLAAAAAIMLIFSRERPARPGLPDQPAPSPTSIEIQSEPSSNCDTRVRTEWPTSLLASHIGGFGEPALPHWRARQPAAP